MEAVAEREVATRTLDDVDVGARLRELRRTRRLTLRQVADRASISEGFLSQVERGLANASIATLRRIVGALGVDIAGLFTPEWSPEPKVLQRAARPALRFGVLGHKYLLTPLACRSIEAFVGEFDAAGSTGDEAYSHGDSDELLLVLDGHVRLGLGDTVHDLRGGDSIVYKSSVPHKLEEVEGEGAQVLWVISPPTY